MVARIGDVNQLSTTVLVLSSASVVVLLLGLYVKLYEVGKASKV